MSGPVSLDYPDYTRVFAAARNLLYLKLSSAIVAPEVSGALAVGNMHSIGLRILANVNHVRITVDWFFDAAFASLVTTDKIEIRQGGTYDQTITCKGAFARITATGLPAGSCTYTLVVYEAPFDFTSQLTPNDNVLLNADTVTVLAGLTTPFEATRVMTGPAQFFGMSIGATTWTIRVQSIDGSGAIKTFLRIDQTMPTNEHTLYLPACTARITIQNADAVDRNFLFNLSAKPFYP